MSPGKSILPFKTKIQVSSHFSLIQRDLSIYFFPKFLCYQFSSHIPSKPLTIQPNHWPQPMNQFIITHLVIFPSKKNEQMLLHCWWECKLIQPLWKTVWRFLKKLGIKPPYDPAIPLPGIYPEETKIEKDTCLFEQCDLFDPMNNGIIVHCNTIYNSYNMKAT